MIARPLVKRTPLITLISAAVIGTVLAFLVGISSSASASVGATQTECDILGFDGALQGEIFGDSSSDFSEMWIMFEQFGCEVTGKMEVASPSIASSGPLHCKIDGNFIRFQLPGERNDLGSDIDFSGLIDGGRISGQYSIPDTGHVSDWTLFTGGSGAEFRLSDLEDSAFSPRQIADIRELQLELTELRGRRSDMAAELEHWVEAESAEIIHRWEQAIDELRAEVEHEIGLETRRIELEKHRVTSRLGRNRVVVELDKELDLIIEQKWDFFDREVTLKQEYMDKELAELQIEKTSQLDRISRLIANVQSKLDEKLEQSGISYQQVTDKAGGQVSLRTNESPLGLVIEGSDQEHEDADMILIEDPQRPEQPLAPSNEVERSDSRGFFFNSESGALGDLGESLDPATLAVLGILITLAATAVQLVKGS